MGEHPQLSPGRDCSSPAPPETDPGERGTEAPHLRGKEGRSSQRQPWAPTKAGKH